MIVESIFKRRITMYNLKWCILSQCSQCSVFFFSIFLNWFNFFWKISHFFADCISMSSVNTTNTFKLNQIIISLNQRKIAVKCRLHSRSTVLNCMYCDYTVAIFHLNCIKISPPFQNFHLQNANNIVAHCSCDRSAGSLKFCNKVGIVILWYRFVAMLCPAAMLKRTH